ncbi:hypothetical protein HDV57DRAFT_306601 [Trichoderma longibrachiatum]
MHVLRRQHWGSRLWVDRSMSSSGSSRRRGHGGDGWHQLAAAVAGGGGRWLHLAAGFLRLNRSLGSASHASVAPRLVVDVSESKGNHTSSSSHVRLPKLPVHGLGCPPWDRQLFSYLGPHISFEPGVGMLVCCKILWKKKEQVCKHRGSSFKKSVLAVMSALYIPLIQPGKLVLAFLIPLTPSLKIVLVVKPAADGAASRKPLRDVLPLHVLAPQLNDEGILFRRPLGLFLDWLIRDVRRHASPAARDERRSYRRWPRTRRKEIMRSIFRG